MAAFVAITVAGPRRICTGLPFEPRAECKRNYNAKGLLSSDYFLVMGPDVVPPSGRLRINQKTMGIVTTDIKVLRTTMEAASSRSWDATLYRR